MKHFEFGKLGASVAASLGLLLITGCNRDHSHGDDHHHGDEPKTAQITVWGERHEIFAEHRFVVAGKPTKFVTHVTDLKTLEPRREGQIKFNLRSAQDAPVEQVKKAPARAGIYEAMLTFPKAGDWNVSVVIPTDEGDKTMALPPVKVFASDHDAAHAASRPAHRLVLLRRNAPTYSARDAFICLNASQAEFVFRTYPFWGENPFLLL